MQRGGGGRADAASVGGRPLRLILTLVGILLVAAGTQVIPKLPLRPLPVSVVDGQVAAVPFPQLIQENAQRLVEAIQAAGPERRQLFQSILDQGRQLLWFDPDENHGGGAWAELVGSINERTQAVGVLVTGGGARIDSENFQRYHQRALDLVNQSQGTLAMVVWAAGHFPKGWIQGAMSYFDEPLGEALARFSHELRAEIERVRGPDAPVRLVVAGHSFGGAVVGTAERYGLDADAILHLASVGVGKVRDPYDYPEPERPRYSMTAPGDLIGYVQGVPLPPGLGHGPDPDTFRCVVRLPTGDSPRPPGALDENGRPLGERAGQPIGGISSHSEIFVRYSDAWWQIYRVFVGAVAEPAPCPPRSEPEQVRVRVLPLVVPRVVTASQCRTTGLRPGGRRR